MAPRPRAADVGRHQHDVRQRVHGALRAGPVGETCGAVATAEQRRGVRRLRRRQFHIPDPDTLGRLFGGVPIRDADAGELEHTGVVPGDGTLFHEESTGKVYVIAGGAKFHVPDPETLNLVFPGFVLRAVWSGALDHVPDRPVDGTFLRERNGTVSVILGGARFAMPDPAGSSRRGQERPRRW